MSRRSLSSVVVLVMLLGLVSAAALLPVPYVTYSPGPTVDVLAEREGRPTVEIDGARTYPTEGSLRLTTVSVTSPGADLSLVEALAAWFDRTRAVYPRDAVYPPEQSVEDVEKESTVQMVSSQDTAVAAALTALGYDLALRPEVVVVDRGSPAEGLLEAGDRLLEVNGVPVDRLDQVSAAVQRSEVGEPAEFVVLREGRRRTVEITTQASPDDPERAVVGIQVGPGYDFPVEVDVRIGEGIGGPSAGLVFSLAVYDELTPGALLEGASVAGTGTIDAEGAVGAIGGIQQKIVAAADVGAGTFLVPADNCEAARGAGVGDDEIRLARVETMTDAVDALEALAANPEAEVPSCE